MNGAFSTEKKIKKGSGKKKKERAQFQEKMLEKKGCCLNESQSSYHVMVVRRLDGGRAATS